MKREKKSACEKSMELVVNIIRISAFSLAAMNLGDKRSGGERLPLKPSTNSQVRKSNKSPKLTESYFKEDDAANLGTTDEGNFSDYIARFHERNRSENEAITDGRAAAFIRKFHEKNSRLYASAAPPLLPLPPPPKK